VAHPLRWYSWLHAKTGFCPVCGRRTRFRLAGRADLRENAPCLHCDSISRTRHLAACLVQLFAAHGVRCARDVADRADLRIYYLGVRGALPSLWGDRPHITYSDYFEGCSSGERRDGVLCQNVERLSFLDGSFDLVVSEDVFEHVADYRQGFREIARVLAPGGHHVFTLPFEFTAHTISRFEKRGEEYVAVHPLYTHADPGRGPIPVFTHFGFDLFAFLDEIGMEASLRVASYEEEVRLGAFNSYTFVTRKR